MKNKAKKIFGSITLGLMGAVCLTGCGSTDSQQNTLDAIIDNSDKLVTSVETYLDYEKSNNTNYSITNEEASRKIEYARLYIKMGLFDELYSTEDLTMYYNCFGEPSGSISYSDMYYRNGDDYRIKAYCYNDKLDLLYKYDFKTLSKLSWSESGGFETEDYERSNWNYFDLDPFENIGNSLYYAGYNFNPYSFYGVIEPEDIYNIEYKDGAYIFTIVSEKYESNNIIRVVDFVTMVDDKITRVETKGLIIDCPEESLLHVNDEIFLNENNIPVIKSPESVTCKSFIHISTYDYSSSKSSIIDEKISEFENLNTNN